ncbi:Pnap_2097 family protein [Sphingobium sp.]|uniref:Pnap_2097 family protein n=1 Tax=Sphingobium sp. TaxID=1912891 RepID=UPI003B3B2BE8
MNMAVPALNIGDPADIVHSSIACQLRLGMPELCRTGLSETWLVRMCGHLHWQALAQAHGIDQPVFRNSEGARLYPAFRVVRVLDGRLEEAGENDLLDMVLTLRRTSRAGFDSEVALTVAGRHIATVTIESAFILRAVEGVNLSARRGTVAQPCLLSPTTTDRPSRPDMVWPEGPILSETIIDPTPHEDFNGVGMLYCASFQAMLDRAEWQWFRHSDPLTTTRSRMIQFLGNIELGDRVQATLHQIERHGDRLTHHIMLRRVSDGTPIAKAVTERAMVPATDLIRRIS